jgi:hypothetical protein
MEIANQTSRDFEQLQQQITGLSDRLQSEVGKWKGRFQKVNLKMAEQVKEGQRKRAARQREK